MPWLLASGFSVADLYAAMFSRWSACHGWRDEHLPKINALAAALALRPAVAPVWSRHFGN